MWTRVPLVCWISEWCGWFGWGFSLEIFHENCIWKTKLECGLRWKWWWKFCAKFSENIARIFPYVFPPPSGVDHSMRFCKAPELEIAKWYQLQIYQRTQRLERSHKTTDSTRKCWLHSKQMQLALYLLFLTLSLIHYQFISMFSVDRTKHDCRLELRNPSDKMPGEYP